MNAMADTLTEFIGGPMVGESVALDAAQEFFVYAMPTAQCLGAQEWAAYYRDGDVMKFGGRAYTHDLALEQAKHTKENPTRPKARRKFRGGL